MADETRTKSKELDIVELFATLLLALAAVATAWSSYQANRWNGEQARAASRTNGLRIEAARAQGLSEAETQVDLATFIQWIDAYATGDERLQDFYEARFRPEFRLAFDAWLTSRPLQNPDAPLTPFKMPEYQQATKKDVARLDAASAASSETVQRNIQRSANYVLAVVLFAATLFFAGISTKLHSRRLQVVLLVTGWVVFAGTVVWLTTFPVSITV
jgi:hypothetical protein